MMIDCSHKFSFQCGLVAYKWPKNTDFLISFLHPTTIKKKLYCILKLLVMMQGKFWALFHFIFLKFLKPQNPDFWYVPDTITSYSIWKQHKIFILVQDKKKIIQHQNSFALFLAITSKSNEEVEYHMHPSRYDVYA